MFYGNIWRNEAESSEFLGARINDKKTRLCVKKWWSALAGKISSRLFVFVPGECRPRAAERRVDTRTSGAKRKIAPVAIIVALINAFHPEAKIKTESDEQQRPQQSGGKKTLSLIIT